MVDKILLFLPIVLLVFTFQTANAEVISFGLENESYQKDEQFSFSGTESDGSKSVFVVIRAPNGNFMGMVSDPSSDSNGSFSTIPRDVTDYFSNSGIYKATVFSGEQKEEDGVSIQLEWDGTYLHEVTESTISVSTDKSSYSDGDLIRIFGEATERIEGTPVALKVVRPDGESVAIEQLDLSYNNQFNTSIRAGGSLWELDGIYVVKV
ncbi:MAG: hypothetical protein GWN01_16055 [Nitrosopumilaceae archaeon]|nr:hypothetical protein [Nitrosopumilaceae archaeon]NIU02351.1 hypothetical protein [Nitrosopumilaceae archaeon]NIU88808.1 hypothetical protein [Nitrosopumilaceae archaeon]NIV66933.1 hypothetical protein [Nitrosopumilaceae archaeon]NIX62952.1 hypothetical protein [Nitrosopumilaceae archaeon]